MRRIWGSALGIGAVVALIAAVVIYVLRTTESGSFDPISAIFALLSVGLTASQIYQSKRNFNVKDVANDLREEIKYQLAQSRRHALGGETRAIDIHCRINSELQGSKSSRPSRKNILWEDVIRYYLDNEPHRMVITGAGGSGKTVLAMDVILKWINKPSENEPVPILIPAADLDIRHPVADAVSKWVVGFITQEYRLSKTAAWRLVRAGMIIPVFDALDEMDRDDRDDRQSIRRITYAINAFNAYVDGRYKGKLIATCRTDRYARLRESNTSVKDAIHAELLPVDPAEAKRFLRARASDVSIWRPVFDVMKPGRPLAAALSTPWRLVLASTVYSSRYGDGSGGNPSELVGPEMDSEEKIRDHLITDYIPAVVGDERKVAGIAANRVRDYLATIAAYLDRNSQSELIIRGRSLPDVDIAPLELWPLSGGRRPLYINALLLALVLFVGNQVALMYGPVGRVVAPFFGGPSILGSLAFVFWQAWPQRAAVSYPAILASLGLGFLFGIVTVGSAGLIPVVLMTALSSVVLWISIGSLFDLVGYQRRRKVPYDLTPRSGIRNELTFSAAVTVLVGVSLGLVFGVSIGAKFGSPLGIALGSVAGVTFGLVAGLTFGCKAVRYVILLACSTRLSKNPLPWRLARFLDDCHQVGLLRRSGTFYQFRHREVQEYLARQHRAAK
ncbi:NACHT domain-containing protein [Herbidospora sp. RD11066]